ncbi:MAG TPA: hypothetical protein VNR18_13950 [Hyphomicrobiales bacterium]|nr:hypothetical protein [Hyphomicrobiales bacterium]
MMAGTARRLCLLATALALPLPAALQAQELRGTLFTSPQQREYLDHLRSEFLARSQSGGFDIQEAEVPQIPTAVPEPMPNYAFGGIMMRSDGSRTVWLNGRAIDEPDLPAGIRLIEESGNPVLRVSTANGSYSIKPGQTLVTADGQVRE